MKVPKPKLSGNELEDEIRPIEGIGINSVGFNSDDQGYEEPFSEKSVNFRRNFLKS